MRTTQLECFASVARHRSFTKAAEELHIAQPAVSQQIQALEQELGFRLFDRSHQEVSLTRAGRAYYLDSLSILEALDTARAKGTAIAQGYSGELCFGVFGSTQSSDMQSITRFHRENPGIQLSFKRAFPKMQHQQLVAGEFDLCFTAVGHICDDERIAISGKKSSRPFVLVHQSHPLASRTSVHASELARYIHIFAEHDDRDTSSVIPPLLGENVSPESIRYAEDQDIAWLMMRLGLGVEIVPESVVSFKQEDIHALAIEGIDWELETAWVYLEDNENPALKAFLRFLD